MSSPPRPQLARSPTWPPTTVHVVTNDPHAHRSKASSLSAAVKSKPDHDRYFEDDLEDHPEDHFLSPMYEYEEWTSSDEDDDDDVEWDAGITDFALFDNDRRHAQETDSDLDGRWDHFMASQRSALNRAVERTRSAPEVDTSRPPLPAPEVPGLTPDTSPELRDDLDTEASSTSPPSSSVPNYLTITLTPPSPEESSFDSDDDLPLSFHYKPAFPRLRHQKHKLQRPGLRHARTLSGKLHSWKRPSWRIYSVAEECEGEGGDGRGRRGSR